MRKFFYGAAVFIFANALALTAATRSETYTYHGEPGSPSTAAMYGERVNVSYIDDEPNGSSLNCFGAGNEICSWQDAYCSFCEEESYNPFDDENSLYTLGAVDDLIKYAETQISNGTYSGTQYPNIIVGSTTYYRTVSWNYNTVNGRRDCTVTITEVTP